MCVAQCGQTCAAFWTSDVCLGYAPERERWCFEIKLIVAPLSRSSRTECPSIRRRTYQRSPLGVFSVSSSSSGSSSTSSSQTSDLLHVDRGRVERHTDPTCYFLEHR